MRNKKSPSIFQATKKVGIYIKNNWFSISIFLIVILAAFLRFYDFENRWGLAYDQARDALIARQALNIRELPLIGPFASAGPFVYGPQWFWIIMLMTLPFPSSVLSPWIFQNIIYILSVLIMIIIGKEIEGRLLGIILGLMTAVSTAQIAQAVNLSSPSMVSLFSMLSLLFFIRCIKYGKDKDYFLVACSIALAINIHFQALGLIILIPLLIIFAKRKRKFYFLLLTGLIIPFIPLIIFDLKTNFFESKNLLQYYLHDQYKISFEVLGRRWLTYLGFLWPKVWARILGGNVIISYLTIILIILTMIFTLVKLKMNRIVKAITLCFVIIIIMLRYFRGPLFDSYFVFIHSFIFILTGWMIFQIIKYFKFGKIIGSLLIALIFVGSIVTDIKDIKLATNYTAQTVRLMENVIYNKFPKEKFSLYDYHSEAYGLCLSLSLFMESKSKIHDNGKKIGLISHSTNNQDIIKSYSVLGEVDGFYLLNLDSSTSAQLNISNWILVTPSEIYETTVKWYLKNEI